VQGLSEPENSFDSSFEEAGVKTPPDRHTGYFFLREMPPRQLKSAEADFRSGRHQPGLVLLYCETDIANAIDSVC
jgi:hypothetical protein